MANQMFNEDEVAESEYLEQAEQEKTRPAKKSSVKSYMNQVAFKEDISINPADLDNAFLTQAALFAHYAMQMAKANEQVDNLKLLLDVKEAQLNSEHRDALAASGGKITEQMVTNAVLTDSRYIKVRKAYNEAKTILEMLKGATDAFKQRRDMLTQLGNNERQERKGELFIRSKEEQEVELRNRKRKVVGE